MGSAVSVVVYIGTSGWQYRDWRGAFYPERMPQKRWLEHYAAHFATTEVNNTFYRLPKPETFAAWRERTPDDFVMAFKASRFLTHVKRLEEPREPVERFLSHVGPLGDKLGAVLVQLPPTFHADVDRLAGALAAFPGWVRVAVEFRHDSWYTEQVREVLAERGAALCLADRESELVTPVWRTAPWTLIRFHAGRGEPHPCYGRTALDSRARLLAEHFAETDRVFAFFNNDTHACAVRDARRFAHACQRAGLSTTRVPGPGHVRVGAGDPCPE